MKKTIFTFFVCALCAHLSAQVFVSSSEQVGIGTQSPQYKLDVSGDARVTGTVFSNSLNTVNGNAITFMVNNTSSGSTGSSAVKNVFWGFQALNSATGSPNTAIGYQALFATTTGYMNSAIGYQSLYSNVQGIGNTANGCQSLYSIVQGLGNTANGYQALYSSTASNYNTSTGHQSLYSNTTGSKNSATGNQALYKNTTGERNTATGNAALYSNETGSYNTVSGSEALSDHTTGDCNTATGYMALNRDTGGNYNTADGSKALFYNSTGNYNTAGGCQALYNNTTGSYNTAIGFDANVNAGNWSNSTAIGNGSRITASNQVRVGNSAVNSIGGQVGWTTLSDVRAKKNIREDVPGLAFIKRLQPVTYNLDMDAMDMLLKNDRTADEPDLLAQSVSRELKDMERKARADREKQIQTGFLAQDVEAVAKSIGYEFSGVEQDDSGVYGLRYGEFVVPLVKAVQELSGQNERLQEQNNRQQAQIDELIGLVNKLLEK